MDARAAAARASHARAADAGRLARQHRAHRDELVIALRADNPTRWTHTVLAAAVGCSPELMAAILSGRTGGPDR